MLKNELFFTFELNKRQLQKNVEFVSNLDEYKFWGIWGILEGTFIPHSRGMKKDYSPMNRNSDYLFCPFLKEDNFMRNCEL